MPTASTSLATNGHRGLAVRDTTALAVFFEPAHERALAILREQEEKAREAAQRDAEQAQAELATIESVFQRITEEIGQLGDTVKGGGLSQDEQAATLWAYNRKMAERAGAEARRVHFENAPDLAATLTVKCAALAVQDVRALRAALNAKSGEIRIARDEYAKTRDVATWERCCALGREADAIRDAYDALLERQRDERMAMHVPPPRKCRSCGVQVRLTEAFCGDDCRRSHKPLMLDGLIQCEHCASWLTDHDIDGHVQDVTWCSPECLATAPVDFADYADVDWSRIEVHAFTLERSASARRRQLERLRTKIEGETTATVPAAADDGVILTPRASLEDRIIGCVRGAGGSIEQKIGLKQIGGDWGKLLRARDRLIAARQLIADGRPLTWRLVGVIDHEPSALPEKGFKADAEPAAGSR
jgi:hypothetical protein